MSVLKELQTRSGSVCELCGAKDNLDVFEVPPAAKEGSDKCLLLCSTCSEQIEDPQKVNANHWRCLNDSMWSEVPAVQVMAWRMLNRLKDEGWPQDLLDMLYLDEETMAWAKATGEDEDEEDKVIHKDVNGVVLQSGDSVVLIKDLNVKGGGFTAKRGTHVRNISLDYDNAEFIEGRVSGQMIVILTQYVKKA